MSKINQLIQMDRDHPKRIAIVGDAIVDEWRHGTLGSCQDGCPKFVEEKLVITPGGAANAAGTLSHWRGQTYLISPVSHALSAPWRRSPIDLSLTFSSYRLPTKTRFLVDGKLVFRHDAEDTDNYGVSHEEREEWRDLTIKAVRTMGFHAVLVCDYDKGFLDNDTIRQIVRECRDIPVVLDLKRAPTFPGSAVVKCNGEYAHKFHGLLRAPAVCTHGKESPFVIDERNPHKLPRQKPIACVNHVGAGDCFGAHLALGLAHGLDLSEAAFIAHSAGRVYVQHPHNRAPYPHEIRRDLDPVGGKVLRDEDLAVARKSTSGRVVFTNGIFRVPHAGHAWLLRWAKAQGDTLVVGVNDDASAGRQRPGEYILPLSERLEILASMEAVDWVVPFTQDEPGAVIGALRPDVLVKGYEYQGQHVPGDDVVGDVRFAPEGPYPGHCADLVAAVRG